MDINDDYSFTYIGNDEQNLSSNITELYNEEPDRNSIKEELLRIDETLQGIEKSFFTDNNLFSPESASPSSNEEDNHDLQPVLSLKDAILIPIVDSIEDFKGDEGQIIFNRSDKHFYGYDGNKWTSISHKEQSNSQEISIRSENGSILINTKQGGSITLDDNSCISNKDNLHILSDNNVILEGGDYVLIQGPSWLTEGLTIEAKSGIPGLTAIDSMTIWNTDSNATGYPDNCEGLPLASIRTNDSTLHTWELCNRWSIIHLYLDDGSINEEKNKVLCFAEPDLWDEKFVASALEKAYQNPIDTMEINKCEISPPQGFIGGKHGRPLPTGLYEINFTGYIRSNPHRSSLEDWRAMILTCQEDYITILEQQSFTVNDHGLKTLLEKKRVPFAYEKEFKLTTYLYSEGNIWVGPNVSSPTAAYKLHNTYFTVKRVAS